MTLNLHHLTGCSPSPLALYLKALGILRIVAEQADSQARGWWQDEHFCLLTTLDREELESFFLEDYSPSSIFNPWGARSGFYDGGNEKTSRLGLTAIETSDFPRLKAFRECIGIVRRIIEENGGSKPASKSDPSWFNLVSSLQQRVRGSGSDWLCTVLAEVDNEFIGPPIFGSGGNEGSGSYTAAYFAAVNECIVRRSVDEQLTDALWHTSTDVSSAWDGSFCVPKSNAPGKTEKKNVAGPFRQFLPEGNATTWDLMLMFEGSLLIRSAVTNRSTTMNGKYVSSPFYFAPHGVGAATSCDSDEFVINKGKRLPGRGEQWFPIWNRPTTYPELAALISDGRCSSGRTRAKKPIDAARAIGRLGIARGVSEFVRYGYLQRNNLATHFAVPLGRIRVRENPRSHLIDDISTWMNRLQKPARDSHAPARLVHAERRLADAVFAVLTHDESCSRWQSVLEAAVDIETIQSAGTAIEAGPIPKLKPAWVSAIHDNSPEFRLALAIGSAAGGFTREQKPFDPIRHNWLPLERGARRFHISDKHLVNDPRVVATGRDPIGDCGAIVQRRLIDAEGKSQRTLPLKCALGCGARLSDLAQLIDGHIDLARVLKLSRALMAVDWHNWSSSYRDILPKSPPPNIYDGPPDEAWLVLRLACLPWPVADGVSIRAEPGMVRRLLSGDGTAAVRMADRRLQASGLRIPFQAAIADADTARLWAAALAFPISRFSARRAVKILVPSYFGESHA